MPPTTGSFRNFSQNAECIENSRSIPRAIAIHWIKNLKVMNSLKLHAEGWEARNSRSQGHKPIAPIKLPISHQTQRALFRSRTSVQPQTEKARKKPLMWTCPIRLPAKPHRKLPQALFRHQCPIRTSKENGGSRSCAQILREKSIGRGETLTRTMPHSQGSRFSSGICSRTKP